MLARHCDYCTGWVKVGADGLMYAAPECTCGHPAHGDTCDGTLSTVSDGDWVAAMIHDGGDPNEPCVCTQYRPGDEA